MEMFESRLLPILRQGVAIIQMVFFRRLRDYLALRYPDSEAAYINMLSGAVVNDIFGTPNTEEPYASFVKENSDLLQEEIKKVPFELVDMMVPLTDALRVQVICDQEEGIDSSPILIRANELKILLVPRGVPLPARFISLVRELGDRFDILLPPEIKQMSTLN